jgi:hypothetical protein
MIEGYFHLIASSPQRCLLSLPSGELLILYCASPCDVGLDLLCEVGVIVHGGANMGDVNVEVVGHDAKSVTVYFGFDRCHDLANEEASTDEAWFASTGCSGPKSDKWMTLRAKGFPEQSIHQ